MFAARVSQETLFCFRWPGNTDLFKTNKNSRPPVDGPSQSLLRRIKVSMPNDYCRSPQILMACIVLLHLSSNVPIFEEVGCVFVGCEFR